MVNKIFIMEAVPHLRLLILFYSFNEQNMFYIFKRTYEIRSSSSNMLKHISEQKIASDDIWKLAA